MLKAPFAEIIAEIAELTRGAQRHSATAPVAASRILPRPGLYLLRWHRQ